MTKASYQLVQVLRNAGFACFGSISELISDNKKLGEDTMLQIVEKRFKGIEKIKKYFPKSIIDYKNWGGYELFTHKQYTTHTLQHDIQYMNNLLYNTIKKENVFQLTNDKISQFQFRQIKNLVFNPYEGQLHSAKLLEALTQEAVSKGIKIMQNIQIKKIHHYTNEVMLACKQDIVLKTKRVIICTNAFAKQLIPTLDIIPARGQVLLTESIPNLPLKGTFHLMKGIIILET